MTQESRPAGTRGAAEPGPDIGRESDQGAAVSQDWAPPSDDQSPIAPGLDHLGRYPTLETAADEQAPVDRQADPAHWLPGRALIITALVVGVALVATIVICLLIWLTPPMHHLQVPSVPRS